MYASCSIVYAHTVELYCIHVQYTLYTFYTSMCWCNKCIILFLIIVFLQRFAKRTRKPRKTGPSDAEELQQSISEYYLYTIPRAALRERPRRRRGARLVSMRTICTRLWNVYTNSHSRVSQSLYI